MASKLPPDARLALSKYFEHLLFGLMIGMTKARDVEKEHGKLGVRVKELTEERMESVAREAGAFFAMHANPSPTRLTPEEIDGLKIKAIEHAFKKMENDAKSDQKKKR